jgi:anti-sigma B factor antagonist
VATTPPHPDAGDADPDRGPDSALVVDTRAEDGYVVVTPHGEIDLATVQVFRDELIELLIQGRVHLLVDLDDTTFFDSLAFGALVAARRKAQVFNGSLGIVCSDPRLLGLFEITGLDRVFTITATAAEQPRLDVAQRSDRPETSGRSGS